MKITKTLLVLSGCIVAIFALAGTGEKDQSLSSRRDGWEVQVVQETRSGNVWNLYWGVGDETKSFSAVKELRLTRKGKPIALPASATSGLTKVNKISLTPTKNGCSIRIDGSSTGEHYQCRIVVKGDQVTQREVVHGEMGAEASERTTYRWVPDDGR